MIILKMIPMILPIFIVHIGVPIEIEKEEIEWLDFESTAYEPFCDSGCIGITRTGYDVSNTIYYEDMRIIAVDPDVIPLHSIVEVKTDAEIFTAIALDTGELIKGNIIDLLVETESEAWNWGRRNVKVRVIEDE